MVSPLGRGYSRADRQTSKGVSERPIFPSGFAFSTRPHNLGEGITLKSRVMTATINPSLAQTFLDVIADFDDHGTTTEVHEASVGSGDPTLTYFTNEFWTSAQRAGHSLHEISYRACFKPQLPEFFINRLTSPGDFVYDPFMGRGTTPIQAQLMQRVPIGNDANPISTILTRPRLQTPQQDEVKSRLSEIDWNDPGITAEDQRFLVFFHPDTLRQIGALRNWFRSKSRSGEFDHVDDWTRMVTMSRLTGHSPGFLSVYTLPPNQAPSIRSQVRINQRRNQRPEPKDAAALILRKSASLLRHGGLHSQENLLLCTQAQNTHQIESNSVDLVVTSPPFLDVVDYRNDNYVRAWFADINMDDSPLSIFKNTSTWRQFTADVLAELCRVVKRGGFIAYEVGEVQQGKVLLEKTVVEAAAEKSLPLKIHGVLVNRQSFTKTANAWGVKNNAKGTNTNRVVLMEVIG